MIGQLRSGCCPGASPRSSGERTLLYLDRGKRKDQSLSDSFEQCPPSAPPRKSPTPPNFGYYHVDTSRHRESESEPFRESPGGPPPFKAVDRPRGRKTLAHPELSRTMRQRHTMVFPRARHSHKGVFWSLFTAGTAEGPGPAFADTGCLSVATEQRQGP